MNNTSCCLLCLRAPKNTKILSSFSRGAAAAARTRHAFSALARGRHFFFSFSPDNLGTVRT
jgi:hypothetical protein